MKADIFPREHAFSDSFDNDSGVHMNDEMFCFVVLKHGAPVINGVFHACLSDHALRRINNGKLPSDCLSLGKICFDMGGKGPFLWCAGREQFSRPLSGAELDGLIDASSALDQSDVVMNEASLMFNLFKGFKQAPENWISFEDVQRNLGTGVGQ